MNTLVKLSCRNCSIIANKFPIVQKLANVRNELIGSGSHRSIVIWIPGASPDMKEEIDDFAERADLMGGDEYPYYRKEYMKKKERRFDVHNKWKGRISQHKVRGLVEFIEYKRSHKYQ